MEYPSAVKTAFTTQPQNYPYSNHSLPQVSATNYQLYQPEGFVYTQYKEAVSGMSNPDNSWLVRAGFLIFGMSTAPLAAVEEYIARPILNVPFDLHNAGMRIGEHAARASLFMEQKEYDDAVIDILSAIQSFAEGFVSATSVAIPVGGITNQTQRQAKTLIEKLLERIAKIERSASGKKLTFGIHLKRFFLQDTKTYAKVAYSWGGKLLKNIPGVNWQMHHVFIQQSWFRNGSLNQKFARNSLANDALKRLGDAGWNLIPIPASLNNYLGQSASATAIAATIIYSFLMAEIAWTGAELKTLYKVVIDATNLN